jgi:hypothetical protein
LTGLLGFKGADGFAVQQGVYDRILDHGRNPVMIIQQTAMRMMNEQHYY